MRTNYPSFVMAGSNKKSLAQLRRDRARAAQAATNQAAARLLMGFNILLYSFLCSSAFH